MSASDKTQLILVPCHSIWRQYIENRGCINLGQLPEHWFLAPFQYEGNDHLAFIKHGLKAVQIMLNDEFNKSIVLFSGSQTKVQARCISEAQSYYFLIYKLIEEFRNNELTVRKIFDDEIVNYLIDIDKALSQKKMTIDELFSSSIATEEFALDSFENLLFSIYRFKELTDNYPNKLTIVGFGFKEARFLKYHAKAIDYPASCINYVSVDPVPKDYSHEKLDHYYDNLRLLEQRNAIQLFDSDWYGTKESLRLKKLSRNPFKRYAGYREVSIFDFNTVIEDDKQFFNEHIKGLMPWSSSYEQL